MFVSYSLIVNPLLVPHELLCGVLLLKMMLLNSMGSFSTMSQLIVSEGVNNS